MVKAGKAPTAHVSVHATSKERQENKSSKTFASEYSEMCRV
jgi:hypothetical protein